LKKRVPEFEDMGLAERGDEETQGRGTVARRHLNSLVSESKIIPDSAATF